MPARYKKRADGRYPANNNKKRYRSTFYHNGKQYEATGKNQKEADQKAAIKRDKLIRGDQGISGNMTVANWIDEWLEIYKKPVISTATYKNYLAHTEGVIKPVIGNTRINQVKDIQLQQILNSRAGKSKSDLLHLRITIQAIFKRAVQSRIIQFNPAENLEIPFAKDGTHRSITPAERAAILKLADTHYAGLWVKTLLYTGMRPAETRALDWQDINFDKKIIRVTKSMKAGTKEIGEPKSASGIRDIPLNAALLPALAAASDNKQPTDPVFTQPTTGKRHTKESMACLWNNFKRSLDIASGAEIYRNKIINSVIADDLTPYCLRHTFCTDLQDAGVPLNVAKYIMGHSDISLTAKIYTHTTDNALFDALEKMNKLAE